MLRHGVLARLIGEGDFRRVVLHRVAAVALDGDVEQEKRGPLLLVLKLPDDLRKVGLVADIAVLKGLGHIHVLSAFEGVKAQPGVGLIALPGGALPGVEGQRIIALGLEQRGQRGGGTQHILLVGDAARGQKGHGIPGEEFKLTGAGARTKYRGIGVAKDGVVQGADRIGDALTELKVAVGLKIRPGFVHDGDDIGALHRHLGGLGGLGLLQQGVHLLRGVIVGLLHLQKLGVAEEYRQAAPVLVGPRLVPHVGFHPQLFQLFSGQQEEEAGQPRRQTGQPQGDPFPGGEPQAGLAPLRMEEHHQGRRQKDGDSHLPGGGQPVGARHAGSSAQGGKIPGQNRGAPEGVDKVVGRAPGSGGDVDADGAGGDPPHQSAQWPEEQGHAQCVGQLNGKGHGKGVGPVCKLHEPGGGKGGQGQKDALPEAVFAKELLDVHIDGSPEI